MIVPGNVKGRGRVAFGEAAAARMPSHGPCPAHSPLLPTAAEFCTVPTSYEVLGDLALMARTSLILRLVSACGRLCLVPSKRPHGHLYTNETHAEEIGSVPERLCIRATWRRAEGLGTQSPLLSFPPPTPTHPAM